MINLQESWYQAGIELANPGSAVRQESVARHVTDCATRPGYFSKVEVHVFWSAFEYRANPGSEFVVANTLAKRKPLEPNETNFS